MASIHSWKKGYDVLEIVTIATRALRCGFSALCVWWRKEHHQCFILLARVYISSPDPRYFFSMDSTVRNVTVGVTATAAALLAYYFLIGDASVSWI